MNQKSRAFGVTVALLAASDADLAAGAAPHHLPPCPCGGGSMIIVETFERSAAPRASPSPKAGLRTAMP